MKVKYLRGSSVKNVNVTLRNATGTIDVVRETSATPIRYEGAKLSPVSAREQSALGIEGGAKITDIQGSAFRDSGMSDGFIITHIDKNRVEEPADVKSYLAQARDNGGTLIKGVYPDGRKAYYPMNPE